MRYRGIEFSTESKALVYPSGTVAGYGIIRSLGEAGVPVVALSPGRCDNLRSRYVRERHIVPNPIEDHEAFVRWLIEYGRNQRTRPALVLAEDLYAYIASLYRDELAEAISYPYLSPETMRLVFDKEPMLRLAAEIGIPVPETVFRPDAADIAGWERFPALVKPLVSRFTFDGRRLLDVVKFPKEFGGKAIYVADGKDLKEAARRVSDMGIACLVQEFISEPNRSLVTAQFVAEVGGKLPSVHTARKVRQEPADFGKACVSVSCYIPELREMAERFCKASGFVGSGGIEFIHSNRDGKWYMLEINPRYVYRCGMCALNGVNLPLQHYLICTGQPLFEARQRDGRYWIDIAGDLAGLRWRKGKPEWKLSAWEILRPYLRFNEAVFNWQDPMPGLFRYARLPAGKAKRALSGCFRKRSCEVTSPTREEIP